MVVPGPDGESIWKIWKTMDLSITLVGIVVFHKFSGLMLYSMIQMHSQVKNQIESLTFLTWKNFQAKEAFILGQMDC